MLDMRSGAASDAGSVRPSNEDCVFAGTRVFVVADGVGGYHGGEVASAMAVEVTLRAYRESASNLEPGKRLYRAVQRANIEIHNRAIAVPELRRMGTTLTAVVVEGGRMSAAHVGDCRLYLARRGRVSQMTKDHTVIGERVRLGMISEKDARNHPERSALSRCPAAGSRS